MQNILYFFVQHAISLYKCSTEECFKIKNLINVFYLWSWIVLVCQISFLAVATPTGCLDATPAGCLEAGIAFLEADAPILQPISCLICHTSCFGVRFSVGGLVGVVEVAALFSEFL